MGMIQQFSNDGKAGFARSAVDAGPAAGCSMRDVYDRSRHSKPEVCYASAIIRFWLGLKRHSRCTVAADRGRNRACSNTDGGLRNDWILSPCKLSGDSSSRLGMDVRTHEVSKRVQRARVVISFGEAQFDCSIDPSGTNSLAKLF